MCIQLTRCAANIVKADRGLRSTCVFAIALIAALGNAAPVRADVVGIGDVVPNIDDPETTVTGDLIPNLPRFGNRGEDPVLPSIPFIIVGGTNFNAGGTATGQMTIDIPGATEPLESDVGIIGGNINGLGQVRVLGLNSEWRNYLSLTVGYEGQGFLEVAAGARVVRAPVAGLAAVTNPGDTIASYDLVFGAYTGSQAFTEVDGFASLLYSGNASIGFRGQGRIELTNGSRMITVNEATIGTDVFTTAGNTGIGTGYVLVDGPGTRWNVGIDNSTGAPPLPGGGPNPPPVDNFDGELTIGREGRGTVEVRNRGWVRVETDTLIGDVAGSYGSAYVSGADSLLWTLEELFVGNAAGTATGELHIDALGVARADGGTGAGGTFVGQLGLVELNGGTLITPTVESAGVIRGDGRVESDFVLNEGDIRNAAGLANIRERLQFTGEVENTVGSIIESVGGEMIFEGVVNNSGQVFGRNAIFRFMGGYVDAGGETYIDNTIVEGPLLTVSSLTVGSSGSSAILGDLTLTGTGTLDMEIGADYSQLFVAGNAALAGNINFTLADDYNPQAGDSFEIISAVNRTGTFALATMSPNPGLPFSLAYVGNSVFLEFGVVIPPISADFDGDGTVTGLDLAIWRMNFGLGDPPPPATRAQGDANGDGIVDGADFMIWQQQLGTMPAVPATNPVAGTVPEPSGLALTALGLAALAGLRNRR